MLCSLDHQRSGAMFKRGCVRFRGLHELSIRTTPLCSCKEEYLVQLTKGQCWQQTPLPRQVDHVRVHPGIVRHDAASVALCGFGRYRTRRRWDCPVAGVQLCIPSHVLRTSVPLFNSQRVSRVIHIRAPFRGFATGSSFPAMEFERDQASSCQWAERRCIH
jgi:hypothetical protein